jgi:Protein of unknown function (DUF1524)
LIESKSAEMVLEAKELDTTAHERERARHMLNGLVAADLRPALLKSVMIAANDFMSGGARLTSEMMSIDYILPTNPKPGSEWLKYFPYKPDRDLSLKLGNIVLLPFRRSAKMQHANFATKRAEYFNKKGEFVLDITAGVVETPRWTPEQIRARTTQISAILIKGWHLGKGSAAHGRTQDEQSRLLDAAE